jgi:hypothetical protein
MIQEVEGLEDLLAAFFFFFSLSFFIYSYVHTLFGSFLPPVPSSLSPPYPPLPGRTRAHHVGGGRAAAGAMVVEVV